MNTAPAFIATSGLNTFVDPVRTSNPEKSVLTACLNVDVDLSGRVSRRKGFSPWLSGSWHSLYPCGEYLLGVTGDALSVIQGGASEPIRNVTEGAWMRYQSVWDGGKEVTYYMNGAENGKVVNKVSYPVSTVTYVGPDTSRTFSAMPIGENICLWNARIFVSTGKVVWYSEPFSYEAFDLARCFMIFDSDVKMMLPVQGGLMIGLATQTVFLSGNSPTEFQFTRIADYGVIEGTEAQYSKSISLGDNLAYRPWFFGSKRGVCVLTQSGQVMNVTDKKVPYPEALRGSGGFIDDKFVLNLEG